MERVTGIGGVFFRSRDPEALTRWYVEHLGLEASEHGTVVMRASAGALTVWAPFPEDTEYIGGPAQWMLNFRVRDLDAMLRQLRERGVEVEDKTEDYDYGRFGWARDPEGNRIELWEPAEGG